MEEPAVQPYRAEHQQADDESEHAQRCITATNGEEPGAKQGRKKNRTGFVANVEPHFMSGRQGRDADDTGFVAPQSPGRSKVHPVQIHGRGCNQRTEHPFDFSPVPNLAHRMRFCSLHGAIFRTNLPQRKPLVITTCTRCRSCE